jgi:hypothetical protein
MKPDQQTLPGNPTDHAKSPALGGESPVAPGGSAAGPSKIPGDGQFPSHLVGQPRDAVTAITKPIGSAPDHPRQYSEGPAPQNKIAIPAGEASAVASQLAAARHPTFLAVGERLNQIAKDIIQAVEDTRLHPTDHTQSLVLFTQRIGWLLSEQRKLRIKNGIEPGDEPAVEALRIILTIQRWSDGTAVRAYRGLLVRKVEAEIVQAEKTLQSILEHGHSAGSPIVNEAILKERTQGLISLKGQLTQRLASLNAGGDGRRATLLAADLAAAGGVPKVAAKVAPLLPAARGRHSGFNDQMARVTEALNAVDPATQRAAGLRDELSSLKAQQRQLESADAADRRKRAEELVRLCSIGDLDSLAQLLQHSGAVSSSFEAAVREACGSSADLVVTVSEILLGHRKKVEAEAALKAAHAHVIAGV